MDPPKPRRRWIWRLVLGGIAALAALIIYTFREPGIPFEFLRGKEIVHSRIDVRTRERVVLVQGSKSELVKAAEKEFGFRPFFADPEETQFKVGDSFVSIRRPRPMLASIDPMTNKPVELPRDEENETIMISYTIQPGPLDKLRAWIGGLFSGKPAQKGATGRPTGP